MLDGYGFDLFSEHCFAGLTRAHYLEHYLEVPMELKTLTKRPTMSKRWKSESDVACQAFPLNVWSRYRMDTVSHLRVKLFYNQQLQTEIEDGVMTTSISVCKCLLSNSWTLKCATTRSYSKPRVWTTFTFSWFSENFQIFGKLTDFRKNFRFSENNQIFRKLTDFRKIFRFSENFQKAILETCGLRLDTYISDNWEQQY